MPLTSVIIPCWNALALTRVCLERLERWTTAPYELVLVDNGSTDGTAAWLRAFARRARGPEAVRVLRDARNAGYPAAMNRGLAVSRGRFVVFGNNDAAVTAGWLEGMLEAFRARPGVGGVAPCSNPPGSVARGEPWAVRGLYDDAAGLDRLACAAQLVRPAAPFHPAAGFVPGFWFLTSAAVLARVGAFDEGFSPGGFEDWDLQWRMRRAGLRLGFAERAYVHHVWSGTAAARRVRRGTPRWEDRRRRLLAKHPDAAGQRLEVRRFAGGACAPA
ncbi:MAG: glycosyltransferase family 2 protein [Elusimicrobiota bacterium]|nr:glycosyltransferase family 2 protein [Elusimicrobiota bacterium]